jgi:hypothetical protein
VGLEATFQTLVARFRAAREAFASLRLTVVEDRPPRDEVLLVDRLGNTVEDLRGWIEEGLASAEDALEAVGHPLDSHRARRALALANERFIRLEYKFFFDGASHEQVEELARFGRRRGREWLGWTGSVVQAIDQCREPLRQVDEVLLLAWQEFSERLGTSAVSVQTTNIGQQISAAALEAQDITRNARGIPQEGMT